MAFKSRLTLRAIGLAFALVILVFAGITPARQAFEQKHRIAAEQTKLHALQKKNLELRERLARLQDPDYMEKLAREELGLVKDGEISYVVVPPPASTATVSAPVPERSSLPQRVWDWITGLFSTFPPN